MKKSLLHVLVLVLVLSACGGDGEFMIPEQISVIRVKLNRSSLALNLDERKTGILIPEIIPQDASNKTVLWYSDNPGVATVAGGIVTAVSAGRAVITATTVDGGLQVTSEVIVEDEPLGKVESVEFDKPTMSLNFGITAITTTGVLTPIFTPRLVENETVLWGSSNPDIVSVDTNGRVTALAGGQATIFATTVCGGYTAVCLVTVTPMAAQFASYAAFLAAAAIFAPGYDFGTDPAARGDWAADPEGNITSTNDFYSDNVEFRIHYTYNFSLFGQSGPGNLVPRFEPPFEMIGDERVFLPPSTYVAGSYRSHSRSGFCTMAHYVFTGYRQHFTIGGHSGRAGLSWLTGSGVHNANAHRFSGIAVDLGSDTYIDTIMVFAGAGFASTSQFRQTTYTAVIFDYMPSTAVGVREAFNALSTPLEWAAILGHWAVPGSNPWILAGRIPPDGESWVYVVRFEEPVLARYVRVSFEMAPTRIPGQFGGAAAMVNTFEVYNTRSDFAGFWRDGEYRGGL